MATGTVELPRLLETATDGKEFFTVDGSTLKEFWNDLLRQEPRLKTHLFDESGSLREHVLCFLNGVNTRWIPLETAVQDGDSVLFMQAVTGG